MSTSTSSAMPLSNDSRESDRSEECSSCHVSVQSKQFANKNRFKLKPGEYLFDFEGSTASTQSLSSFIHLVCASNVYRLFFAYTQILQHDAHRCCTTYSKNGQCNRFSDIPCIEETRVHVKHPSEDHDYIHANWVDGYRQQKKFILTQAPLPQTTDQFWRMIWQEKCLVIISMIQTVDVHGAEWAGAYIPKAGEKSAFGEINVQNCGIRRVRETYDATLIKVTYRGSERRLLHLCFFSWGHRGTPKRPTEVLNFISDINFNHELLVKEAVTAQWLEKDENSPIVIHCLAGTARSATIIALDICLRKLDDTATRPCGPMLDVEDVVMRLRTQRSMAVQKPEQYLFLHLAVFEYAVRQRYISEKTYNEIDLDSYFYDPRRYLSKEPDNAGRKSRQSSPKKQK